MTVQDPYVWIDPADAIFVASCREALKMERAAYARADAERRGLQALLDLKPQVAAGAAAQYEMLKTAEMPDRYPDGLGEFDEWRGYRFKAARGRPGLIIEPEEGCGDMPVTFMAPDEAVFSLMVLQLAVRRLDARSPGSYLAELVQDIADDMRTALLPILRKAMGK